MALGKNLKRTKLIDEDSSKKEPKAIKKKTLIKKKEKAPKSSSKPTAKKAKSKPAKVEKVVKAKAKPKVKEAVKPPVEKQEPLKQTSEYAVDPVLSNYIAQELRERKIRLRKQYTEEINKVKEGSIQLVNFTLNDEEYAVDINIIKEIVKLPQLSKAPNTPKHIKGLANVRGVSYVVFDLAARFGSDNIADPTFLMIFSHREVKASLVLESLPTTFKVLGKNITPDMQMIEDATLDLSYIKGVINQDNRLIYYLDIIEMLKNDKAIVIPEELKN